MNDQKALNKRLRHRDISAMKPASSQENFPAPTALMGSHLQQCQCSSLAIAVAVRAFDRLLEASMLVMEME